MTGLPGHDWSVNRGTVYGQWRVLNKIDGGGNGVVYRCQGPDGTKAAIKILRRDRDPRGDRMPRFRNEIRFLDKRGSYPGVLPMLDYALPDDPAESSWYVMPIATPLLKALGNSPEFSTVIDAMAHVARTLARLAAESAADPDLGQGHRDIKPDNLFQLNGEWVIGDFGLVKYPRQERLTKHGRALGPYDFMAPEMRRDADTADPGPADVYSLAKTLWSVAAGQRYPPQGELRRDRHDSRLSSHVDDPRSTLLEPLLERGTSNDPAMRPAMGELAEELAWWSAPPTIEVQADLSGYAPEVSRLRAANVVATAETKEERLIRLYAEAEKRVHSELMQPLMNAISATGLRTNVPRPRSISAGHPDNYGSSASEPYWGIETLASPCLAANIGVLHRAEPATDMSHLGVTVTLAMLSEESQHNYIKQVEYFRAGSLHLDQIIDQLGAKINTDLPAIIAHFLTACQQIGIPRSDMTDR